MKWFTIVPGGGLMPPYPIFDGDKACRITCHTPKGIKVLADKKTLAEAMSFVSGYGEVTHFEERIEVWNAMGEKVYPLTPIDTVH
jgi:hypothetical protein